MYAPVDGEAWPTASTERCGQQSVASYGRVLSYVSSLAPGNRPSTLVTRADSWSLEPTMVDLTIGGRRERWK
ncbi:hypothetical protein L484_014613 [Morus notabilis]|uniref:Uncharacterized protein n=1 Tax=Morus notabilis TaxID=981085 RepID=W9R6L8_9ROSA|nr:hypothetical protein L484_014613 [Morus notabilis]